MATKRKTTAAKGAGHGVGSPLPPEEQLRQEFQVSRVTVRAALATLNLVG